jgi:hypothetical protein
MAVVQISKIQVRRGQKFSNTGVPQLSSGEFAWAVDAQELYIGNGSIAEGAPFVGNTRVLTENSNLIELLGAYQFSGGKTTPIAETVARSLQNKLDESVSVLDFGAVPDGVTDSSSAFQSAVNQLFLNSTDPTLKKTLVVPNGDYRITQDFVIPADTILQGETRNGVRLIFNSSDIRFADATGNSNPENFNSTGNKYPRNIQISNLTIERTTGEVVLSGVKSSFFNNIKFKGSYTKGDPYLSVPTVTIVKIENNVCETSTNHELELGDIIEPRQSANGLVQNTKYYVTSIPDLNKFTLSLDFNGVSVFLTTGIDLDIICEIFDSNVNNVLVNEPAAISWYNTGPAAVTDIDFINCIFEKNTLSIKSRQSLLLADNRINFENCTFDTNNVGIYVQGVAGQTTNWKFKNCSYVEVIDQVFLAPFGVDTQFIQCDFKDCGNGKNLSDNPANFIIEFGETTTNVVKECFFDRLGNAGITSDFTKPGINEVKGGASVVISDRVNADIFKSDTFRPLAVFSAFNSSTVIDYTITLGPFVRKGILQISLEKDRSDYSLVDNYTVISEGTPADNFEFSGALRTNYPDYLTDSSTDTFVLTYVNPISTGLTGNISYSVTYSV